MSWRDDLLPGSFRGVPFFVSEHERTGGRRVVVSEYPLRDPIQTEDLGRTARKYNLTAYVLGDDYFADRDALIRACEEDDSIGTLVHPYLGELRVRCEGLGTKERTEDGRLCVFSLSFVDAGDPPKKAIDTRGGWLATLKAVVKVARFAFRVLNIVRNLRTSILLGWLKDFAIGRIGAFLGFPGLSLSVVQSSLNSLQNLVSGEPDTIADAIQAPHQALADAALATPAPALSGSAAEAVPGAVAQTSRGELPDPVLLVAQVLLLPIPARPADANLTGDEAAAVAALNTLAYGAAVGAAAQIMADTTWPSAAAATAARDALLDAIDVLAEAAADAGQDELHAAWRAVAAAAARDLNARALLAPRLTTYTVPRPISSLVLAHRLYEDAGRADELVAQNAVPHPAFLPATGVAVAT